MISTKPTFLLLFLFASVTTFAQPFDTLKLRPNNYPGGEQFKKARVTENLAIPTTPDTTSKVPGQVKITANQLWYTGNDGVWRVAGTGAVSVGDSAVWEWIYINDTTGYLSHNGKRKTTNLQLSDSANRAQFLSINNELQQIRNYLDSIGIADLSGYDTRLQAAEKLKNALDTLETTLRAQIEGKANKSEAVTDWYIVPSTTAPGVDSFYIVIDGAPNFRGLSRPGSNSGEGGTADGNNYPESLNYNSGTSTLTLGINGRPPLSTTIIAGSGGVATDTTNLSKRINDKQDKYWLNVKGFGAKGDGITDDTQAFQAALDSARRRYSAVIFVPYTGNDYIISGALKTTDGQGHAVNNAQLYIPLSEFAKSDSFGHIQIIGEVQPSLYTDYSTNVTSVPHHMVTIRSTLNIPGGAVLGTAYSGSDYGNWNFTQVTIENLNIRVRSKTGATDIAPTMIAVNALELSMLTVRKSRFDTESAQTSSVQPAATSAGIIGPNNGNFVFVRFEDVLIQNVYTGIRLTECTQLNQVFVTTCYNGIELATSNHPITLNNTYMSWNYNNLYISGKSFINAKGISFENYPSYLSVKWFNHNLDIYEPTTTNSEGDVTYHRVVSNFGISLIPDVSATFSPKVFLRTIGSTTTTSNTNGSLALDVRNTSSGSNAQSAIAVYNNANAVTNISKLSSNFSLYRNLIGNDGLLYNGTGNLHIISEAGGNNGNILLSTSNRNTDTWLEALRVENLGNVIQGINRPDSLSRTYAVWNTSNHPKAQAIFQANNGSDSLQMGVTGAGVLPEDVINARMPYILGTGSKGLTFWANHPTADIKFATGNTVRARIDKDGYFYLGADTVATRAYARSVGGSGGGSGFTTTDARNSISLTTTGTSGAATYNNATGVLNIPNYATGGGSSTTINNTLTSSATNEALSAARGKELKDSIDAHNARILANNVAIAGKLSATGGTINGAINFLPIADPDAPTSGFLVYNPIGGGLAWKSANSLYKREIRVQGQTQNIIAYIPNKDTVRLVDSATNAAVIKNTFVKTLVSNVTTTSTGTTAETIIYTATIPVGTIGPNGSLDFVMTDTCTNNANGKTIRLKINGTTVAQRSQTSSAGGRIYFILSNRNSLTNQIAGGSSANASNVTFNGAGTPANYFFDFGQTVTVTVTVQNGANTDVSGFAQFRMMTTY